MTENDDRELLNVAPGEPHDNMLSETVSFTIVYLIGALP